MSIEYHIRIALQIFKTSVPTPSNSMQLSPSNEGSGRDASPEAARMNLT